MNDNPSDVLRKQIDVLLSVGQALIVLLLISQAPVIGLICGLLFFSAARASNRSWAPTQRALIGALGVTLPAVGAFTNLLWWESIAAVLGSAWPTLIAVGLSVVFLAGVVIPIRTTLRAVEPGGDALRRVRRQLALPLLLAMVGPLVALALAAGGAVWEQRTGAPIPPQVAGLVPMLGALSGLLGTAMAALSAIITMILFSRRAREQAALQQGAQTHRLLEESLRSHGLDMALSEDKLVSASGTVEGLAVQVATVSSRIPYRLRLTLEMPALPKDFTLRPREGQAGGTINDVILDGMFVVGGVEASQARALLADLHTPLMGMVGDSVSISISGGALVVEQYAVDAFAAVRRDGRLLLLDEAVAIATTLNRRAAAAGQGSQARARAAARQPIG